jgi:hypothetical protein
VLFARSRWTYPEHGRVDGGQIAAVAPDLWCGSWIPGGTAPGYARSSTLQCREAQPCRGVDLAAVLIEEQRQVDFITVPRRG